MHHPGNAAGGAARDAGEAAGQTGVAFHGLGVVGGRFGGIDLVTVAVLQLVAVRHDPEIDVGVGAVREAFGDALLAENLDDRLVDVVVPTGDRFLDGCRMVAVLVEPFLVQEDVVQDLVVATERGRADVVIRSQTVEVGMAEELGVLHLQEELRGRHRGVERDADVPLEDLGVDELDAALAGDRDAMVAVFDEVDVPDFVELNRRQPYVLMIGAIDVLPAAGGVALAGEEGAVEVAEAIDAPDYLPDRDRLDAAITLDFGSDAPPHFVVGDQLVRLSPDDGEQLAEERLLARPVEVAVDLFVDHLVYP